MTTSARTRRARLIGFGISLALTSACHNYTTSPLCAGSNGAIPEGLTGTYTVSTQDSDFNVTTSEFTITYNDGGLLVKHNLSRDNDDEESRICAVSGRLIEESFDEEIPGYSQRRLFVTGIGVTFLPMFFDKRGLDEAAIPNKIFNFPDSIQRLAGTHLTALLSHALTAWGRFRNDEPTQGLLVDNRAVSSLDLLPLTATGPEFRRQRQSRRSEDAAAPLVLPGACQIGSSWYLQMVADEGTWSPVRFDTSPTGITLVALTFKPDELARAGVRWDILPVMADMDGAWSFESNRFVVDNRGFTGSRREELIALAHPLGTGMVLSRIASAPALKNPVTVLTVRR